MLYGTFAQVMQIAAPLTRVREIFGNTLGNKNMTRITAIHHSLCNVNSSACNVSSAVYVPNFINWPTVNPHSKLHPRMLFKLFTDLDCAPDRRFGAIEEYQSHSIASWQTNQFIRRVRSPNLIGIQNDFRKVLKLLALLIQEEP